MKKNGSLLAALVIPWLALFSQNVGIGTTLPEANLHISGTRPSLRIDNNGSLSLYNIGATSSTLLSNFNNFTYLGNDHPTGNLVLRMGGPGDRDVVINGAGMMIGNRVQVLGALTPTIPFEIQASGEVLRIKGTTPYLTMMDGNITRGYIQAWTDGIALASNGYDVGLWTNGAKRLALKPNGALEVAGSTGAAGQVLTSNGAGAPPAWASPGNSLYNSFRFISMSQATFENTSNGTWRDIPGLTYSFVLSGNHYVDVATIFTAYSQGCFNCDRPPVAFRLLINGNQFTGTGATMESAFVRERIPITTGFTLPAGNHTIKWQIFSSDGSNVVLENTSPNLANMTYMRVWMVPQ